MAYINGKKVPVEACFRIQGWGGVFEDLPKMILCPALVKNCQNVLILNLTFKNNTFIKKCKNIEVKLCNDKVEWGGIQFL